MAQDININIGADASGAVAGFDATANAAGKAAESTQDLSQSLEKQEARIKTLDGAINLLGGSVELLASGLAATGLVTKENAEEFQTAAVAAIAFADGSKRVLDGYKSLTEGLKAYGGISGVATKATQALNTAIRANPAVAIAIGVAALTTAIIAYVNATDDAEEAERRRIDTEKEGISQRLLAISREERLARARGESIEEIARLRIETMQLRLEEIKLDRQRLQGPGGKNVLENQAEINKLGEEYLKLQTEIEATQIETARAVEARNKREQELAQQTTDKIAAEAKKRADDAKKRREDELAAEKKFYDDVFKAQQELTARVKSEFDKRVADRVAINEYEHELLMEEFNATIQAEKKKREAADKTAQAAKQRADEQKEAISATLNAFSNLAQSLADVQDENSKEGFEAGKKYKIAQVVTSAIQSSFEAYSSAQKFNSVVPGLGTAIGLASVAAIALSSKKAIADIQSAQFGGGTNVPSVTAGTGGGTSASVPRGVSNSFAPGGFLAPGVGTPSIQAPAQPIQAYVLASDVTTGVQAYGQISRRRRFG